MDSATGQPHFVLIPLMAQGHMIPMIDMARLFAERGVIVSLVTTPYNASRFQRAINQARGSGLSFRLVQLEFPCQEVGLPEGYENLDILPSRDLLRKFYKALSMLQQPLEKHLEKETPPPTCIISDKCLSWTSITAQNFNIPRLVFHGMGCFSLLSSHNIKLYNAHNSVSSDSEPFVIPGIPHRIEITKAQLPGAFVALPDLDDFRNKMQEAESTANGVVVNSFHELEREYIEEYEKAIKKKVWCVGPVSLRNKENSDMFERGNKASIDEQLCIGWLNSKKSGSVIYACLGSLCRLVPAQLIELGLGLEASNQPFIWVIKTGERHLELEEWLVKERFEERIKGRGLLIKGWAPQMLILSHPAVGGFITHCGWNSTLESVCSGVPMITWPLFAEQFFNEKLVVEVLRIGIKVGVEIPVRWGDEEKVGVLVKKDGVEKAITMLMDGGEEGEKRRKKARELGEMGKRALEEGGSSQLNMSFLIEDITKQSTQGKA
ncbi:UDP-glycosyltransferase 73D1-like [Alnus glutinosa]|uniref:UDP-glycosyltransferase 73D1-like n=1 Tax=Alnus glutinosa TaxID=3517 RepID=UPI002D79B195|nr:UDP-glycosyltransferase 73D1-like [Alnus glutinosa]XP_062167679.1 UDP-glycosyltransferase 73D1-like [Alnus glutinosa]XP_062167680.1 UDP-glycosyltransferase 73D1-like [Alnus glutinosa]XP_062167681.1 UDP-glycosyltransferase 73D1-like [Alnus glutinosa]XP_062167682.1 UDP-glycosyltransferase 73D1-like [Alnus glutinosa]XP_062167684.1 UDP-glycosyltransferase 73D1-like [Alnus glutinosa]XP_062167685.1 UDP-glycosyltransferase 73D1-like [Alnus glutinosa]XP_062167686.1 UDP-glycosyltransferase 73D1-li